MARVLVEIDDPMSLAPENRDAPVLLIGSYVRVEIEGRELQAVISLSRELLRENETVWLVDQDDRLELRPVEIAYRGRDAVLVTAGLNPGDRVIRTNLAAPVVGMPLRVSEDVRSNSD